MYTYQVEFYWASSVFLETQLVYGVNSRAEAVKAVKNHYGGKSVQIVSARRYDEETCR